MPERDRSFVPRLARKARLRFDRHSQSHMIVYPERGLALNESAAEIAKRCDGTRSIAEIAAELAAVANVPANEIEPDFVAFSRRRGLLEP